MKNADIERTVMVFRLRDNAGVLYTTSRQPGDLSEQCLQIFERAIGRPLPEDFRDFLRTYSGASPKDSLVFNETFSPGLFYGLRPESDTSLIAMWGATRSCLPTYTIPFADDVGTGGMLCLDLEDPISTPVVWYFADAHEVVSPSFNAFLGGLKRTHD